MLAQGFTQPACPRDGQSSRKKATYSARRTNLRRSNFLKHAHTPWESFLGSCREFRSRAVSSVLEPNHVLGPCRPLPRHPVAFGFQECSVSGGQVEGEATFLSFFHLPELTHLPPQRARFINDSRTNFRALLTEETCAS